MSIQMGEYILSSLTPASRSEDQNYGIILNYSTEGELMRWNTGSIRNQSLGDLNIQLENGKVTTIAEIESDSSSEESESDELRQAEAELCNNTIILKAVRYNILGELDDEVESCKQQIHDIVKSIAVACGHSEDDKQFVIQKPIIR